ncbi:MAG: PP2C family protein-serine/threonine phosphatase, partial [Chloroflexota bacterium]
DYLPKPFEPTLLCARIASSLEKKHLRNLQHLYLKGLERELDIAREIQLGFLPSDLPRPDGWEVAAYLKAAREVAGDFYDAFLLPDANLAFVVGDVCGKGVGAALFMTLFRSLIRITATTDAFSTSKEVQSFTPTDRLQHIVSFTNNYVSGTHAAANMFATVFIGIVDLQTGMLNYINCGNESPLLLRNGSVVACLPPTGPVIGIILDAKYTVQSIQLERDDLLLAFTDGIPDAIDAQNTSFGSERLYHALNGQNATSELILNLVEDSLSRFIGTTDQFDDITLMAIKRCV